MEYRQKVPQTGPVREHRIAHRTITTPLAWSALIILLLIPMSLFQPPEVLALEVFQISACDTGGEWDGGVVTDNPVQEGNGSIRWSMANGDQLSRNIPLDLTGYNMLSFWLHANHPHSADGNILLFLGSENTATEGMDYYSLQIPINWEGWREFNIPIDALGASRVPKGYDQIDSIRLNASGWGNTPDETLELHIDNLRAENRTIEGPMVTVEELFGALDLSRAGLETVRTAYGAGDIATSITALCEYFRARTTPAWKFDPHTINTSISYNRDGADATVDGTFTIVGHTYTFPEGSVDWSYNPTEHDPDVAYSKEWLWQLGRMGYWSNLGRAYWATGDRRYVRTFIDHLQSFIVTRPVPQMVNNGGNSSWRTIEAGIRMAHTWPDAWNYFLHAPEFTDADMLLMLRSFYEHGRYLRAHQTSGNWILHELGGLFALGSIFPEFSEAAEWRTFSAERMHSEMSLQLLPDGGQWELSPGYHRVSIEYLSDLVEIANITGTAADVPNAYTDGLRKGYHWLINLATPTGGVPHLNDSWNVNVASHVSGGLDLFPEDALIAWAASNRTEGAAPSHTSIQLKASGYTVLRSGWETDAHYAVLDVGPLGYGHYHQDKLNLVLYPYGRQLLFDNGGGNYEYSPFRLYGTATQSHNTIIVDGLPQRRPERSERKAGDAMGAGDPHTPPSIFHTEASFDYVSGVYQDGYGERDHKPATHHREVLFVKPSMFLVVDHLRPNDADPHDYQARWHLRTTNWVDRQVPHATITTDSDLPNLAILPLQVAGLESQSKSGVTEPELLGWELGHAGGASKALTVLHNRHGAGLQRFVTLLLPLSPGETLAVSNVSESADGSYEVNFDNGLKTSIVLSQETAGGMTVTTEDHQGNLQEINVDPSKWDETIKRPSPPGGLQIE